MLMQYFTTSWGDYVLIDDTKSYRLQKSTILPGKTHVVRSDTVINVLAGQAEFAYSYNDDASSINLKKHMTSVLNSTTELLVLLEIYHKTSNLDTCDD
mgnify:CR=1 FL=1